MKDLDVMLGAESAVLILDDTQGVWPRHASNLLLVREPPPPPPPPARPHTHPPTHPPHPPAQLYLYALRC